MAEDAVLDRHDPGQGCVQEVQTPLHVEGRGVEGMECLPFGAVDASDGVELLQVEVNGPVRSRQVDDLLLRRDGISKDEGEAEGGASR